MEFTVGLKLYQVLSDLRVREIELVEIREDTWSFQLNEQGEKVHPYTLKFLPANRKGPGFEAWHRNSLTLKEGETTVLSTYKVFATVEAAHQAAVEMATRNVKYKHYNVAKAKRSLAKAEATLRDVRKAAEVA